MNKAWGDINQVFGGGWPPSEMNQMPLSELANWWHDAVERYDRQNEK